MVHRPGPSVLPSFLLLIVVLGGLAALAPPALAQSGDQAPLRLLRVNPSGVDVPPAKQIVLQFDRPVVPLGRMERDPSEIPIRITPDPGCEWRWMNRSALSCRLAEERELLPATRYRVVVSPGITTEEGLTMAEPVEHEFVTVRPKVYGAWFEEWRSPGMPRVRIVFSRPVTAFSVEEHLFFRVAGSPRLPVEIEPVEGSDTAWYLRPAQELPPDSRVSLAVEPGLHSTVGSEPGVERRDLTVFRTFPEFRFLGISCRNIEGGGVRLAPGRDPRTVKGCEPDQGVSLVFSSPVVKEVLRDGLSLEPGLAREGETSPWDRIYSSSRLSGIQREHRYDNPLPSGLAPVTEYRLRAEAEAIRDEFDRPLAEPLDLAFLTDHRRSMFRLGGTETVLESQVESHLPVAVTNVDRIEARVDLLTAEELESGRVIAMPLPERTDVTFLHPLRVREWLGGRSGAVMGSLQGYPKLRQSPHWFFTQVTPYGIHVKLGHYNTLVWVTDLATGRPVRGATVEIVEHPLARLTSEGKLLGAGRTGRDGVALLEGAETIDPERAMAVGWRPRSEPHLWVRVEKEGELALIPLDSEFHLWARAAGGGWIHNLAERKFEHIRAWGATAQGIYRAGDTVQYKVYLRNEGNLSLAPAPAGPYHLKVVDPTDKVVHERKELTLDAFGAFDGEFTLPETGAVGWYHFRLSAGFAEGRGWVPLRVLVTDFTPAPFRVSADLSGELFAAGDEVTVSSQAALHAGGPYADAQARVSASVSTAPFRPAGAELRSFRFDTGDVRSESLHQSEGTLDGKGEIETRFTVEAREVIFGTLTVETAVRADRGKSVAARATARYAGRDRYIGIRHDGWILKAGESAEVQAVVTDAHGEPAAGTDILFRIERLETRASRVKGAGNAYLTEYVHEWVETATCREASGGAPVSCVFTPGMPGSHRMTASIVDSQGRAVASTLHRWSVGPGRVLFEESPGHELEILPEKETLRVGEKARFLVKNPFPGARALVTVERNGVIDSRIETLKDSTALLEIPVGPDHLPGFYLSVVVSSPRVEVPPGDGRVDLGKPAFRMGYARIEVRDPYKELRVQVRPDAEIHKPGETVSVELRARTSQGRTPETELAVAVLDESVLDLIAPGARAWDPYAGFYELGALDLFNYNLLKNLIGLRKFETKGANPGGGGGPEASMRSDFRFVSYWNPSVRTDRKGRARIEFTVPDNLTAWRVLVMAVTPEDRMGLGQASFRVNRPTEIRPALPNQVVEGDRFEARFTVMNRTDRPRTLEVVGGATGSVKGTPELRTTIEAEPFRRHSVAFPVESAQSGALTFTLTAGDATDADGLRLSLPVKRMQSLETASTYGSTTEPAVEESLVFPSDMREDTGSVGVVASPTVIAGLEGAFDYMRRYAYTCWEQRLSTGVMAAHYTRLRDWLPESLDWPGAGELPARTLRSAANFQAPNGGMVYFRPRDEYVSPYLSAYTALAFHWLRDLGHEPPSGVEERLQEYLQTLLRKDAFPTFFSRGMASSVRAVALAALAHSGKVTLDDLRRYGSHVDRMDLFGKAHYLQALQLVEGSEEMQRDVRDAILARADETGGKLVFTEPLDDGYARILHSGPRTSCAVLSALVGQSPEELAAGGAAELPFKIVRAVTQARKRKLHWENTQENMFCANALIDYAEVYERESPRYTVSVAVGGESLGSAEIEGVRQEPALFERPLREGDAGRPAPVRITREGVGRLYYAVRLTFSPRTLDRRSINAGIELRREYSVEREGAWTRLGNPAAVGRGELVRVDLYLNLPAARNFVVLDDPVPGGIEPVNRELATASTVDADRADFEFPPDAFYREHDDWRVFGYTRWSFYHQELRHDAVRFYSEYLPAGRYHLSWIGQVIAPGEFTILPARAEEMYDPDVFGRGVPGRLEVTRGDEAAGAVE